MAANVDTPVLSLQAEKRAYWRTDCSLSYRGTRYSGSSTPAIESLGEGPNDLAIGLSTSSHRTSIMWNPEHPHIEK